MGKWIDTTTLKINLVLCYKVKFSHTLWAGNPTLEYKPKRKKLLSPSHLHQGIIQYNTTQYKFIFIYIYISWISEYWTIYRRQNTELGFCEPLITTLINWSIHSLFHVCFCLRTPDFVCCLVNAEIVASITLTHAWMKLI